MAHRKQGYRFKDDWSQEEVKNDIAHLAGAVPIPVNIKIETNNTVLNLDSVKRLLERAHKIAVTDCACKTKHRHCDSPLNTCLQLNEAAQKGIEGGTSRELTIEEALEVLSSSHKAGLIHMAYVKDDLPKDDNIRYICSCCSCCCSVLASTLRFGLAPHLLKSQAVASIDSSLCTSCGKCVERCHFGAREQVGGKVSINRDMCFGCGLCVSTCPTKATSLLPFN